MELDERATRKITGYTPREAFAPFHAREQRWSCLVCHRRAGKTVAALNDLIEAAVWEKLDRARYAFLAPHRNQAKDLAWTYLKYYTQYMRVGTPNEQELRVEIRSEEHT